MPPGEQEQKPLFDYVLIIKLKNENGALTPRVDYRFPPTAPKEAEEKGNMANSIAIFCFPELEVWEQTINKRTNNKIQGEKSETFNFVLTEQDGSKKFGYCRRYVIDSQPECFCVISFLPCVSLFLEVLNAVEQLRKKSSSAVFSFLKTVLAKQFPNPGETISIRTFDGPTFSLTRSDNNFLLDLVSFKKIFSKLSLPTLLNLFAGVITEARVIITAQNVSTLSLCVSALNGFLYPFSWQFVYIPILPAPLLTYCCAPMPFLVGVLSCNKKQLMSLPIDEGLMLDMDSGSFIRPIPSHLHYKKVIPSSLLKPLKYLLKEEMSKNEALESNPQTDKQFDTNISKIFLGFFHQIFGNYQSFFASHKFNPQRFKDSKPPDFQPFLELLGETQMYNMFIEERQEMSKCGKLNLCPLILKNRMTWCEEDELVGFVDDDEEVETKLEEGTKEFKCELCESIVDSNKGVHKKYKFYCTPCYESVRGQRNSFSFKGIKKQGSAKIRNIRESFYPGKESSAPLDQSQSPKDAKDTDQKEQKKKETKEKEPKEKVSKEKGEKFKDLLGKASSSSRSAVKMLSMKMKAITSDENLNKNGESKNENESKRETKNERKSQDKNLEVKNESKHQRKSDEIKIGGSEKKDPITKSNSFVELKPSTPSSASPQPKSSSFVETSPERKWGKPSSLPGSPLSTKSKAERREKKAEFLSTYRRVTVSSSELIQKGDEIEK